MLCDKTNTYPRQYLTAIYFSIGAMGDSEIRMNGQAEREWWYIFNYYQERSNLGKGTESFFCSSHQLEWPEVQQI